MADLNDPTFWQRRLAGEVPPITEQPEYGFYKIRARQGVVWYPIAYWYGKDGALRCRASNRDIDETTALERWPYASKNPITYETYKAVVNGAPWPDDHEAVTRDRQNSESAPDDNSFEALKDRIEDLAREAEKLIKGGAAADHPAANRAADLANRLGELHTKADLARKVEKRPHDEAAAAVQKKWMPIIDTAEIYKRIKAAVITPFLIAEEKRQEAAAASARAEAQANGTQPAPVTRAAPKAGSGGRRSVALRDYTVVTITDREALLEYFKGRDEITAVLQQMAEQAVTKAKITPPGVEVKTEKRAA